MAPQCPRCQSTIALGGGATGDVVCPLCGARLQPDPDGTLQWLPGAEAAPAVEAPRRIGKFEVLELLGSGTFGTVYKARDTELDRLVAIKVPRTGSLPAAAEMDRFLREAKSAAPLRHPGIVALYDAGTIDGACVLVSEFIPGTTLAERLRGPELGFRPTAELLAEVADALDYAHRHGVIHRDLKPSNIMLDLAGRPHLMDFGLAKRAADEATLTLEGQVLGTPAYMAPEQARGEVRSIDARSDIYSLGVVLYQMLTGELPFRGQTRMLLVQVIQDEPRPPRRINDRIPRDLETICLKAMAKEPARRYSTAAEMADDLRRFLRGEPIQARPVGPAERLTRWCRRNPRTALLTGSVAVLLVVLALGSTAAAFGLRQERDAARAAEERAVGSERERRQELYRAYLNEARASRLTGRVGQRENGLKAIRNILSALPPEELTREQRAELRDEALACLTFADVRERFRRPLPSSDFFDADVHPAFDLVAWGDEARGRTVIEHLDAEGEPLASLPTPGAMLQALRTFSPDGRWLAEQFIPWDHRDEHRLRVWDCRERRVLLDQVQPSGRGRLAFHPQRPELLIPGRDEVLRVVDLTTGRPIRQSPPRFRGARVAYSPDGRQLAVASRDVPTAIVDAETWQTVTTLPEAGATTAAVWAPDGHRVVFGTLFGGLYMWHTGPRFGHTFGTAHRGWVEALAFSPDGTMLASSGQDNTVTLRLVQGDRPFVSLPGRFIRFSADSRRLAIVDGRDIHIGEITGGRACLSDRAGAEGVEFSPDGRWLATGGADGARLFSAADCSPVAHLGLDPCGPPSFHPSGDLVTFGLFSHAWRWPFTPPTPERPTWRVGPARRVVPLTTRGFLDQVTLQPHHLGRHTASRRDGQALALADNRYDRVLLIDAGPAARPRTVGQLRSAGRVAISPDGRWVAAGAIVNPTARVWDTTDGRVLLEIPGHTMVAASADGRWLSSTSWQTVHLYDPRTWRRERAFERDEADRAYPSPVALQPGGRLIAFALSRRRVRLCDCETGQVVANLALQDTESVTWLAFSPDGTRLAFMSGGWQVGIWDLHELRVGLAELGLDEEALPRRLAPLPPSGPPPEVVRGPDLPGPEQWSRNWLLMAQWHMLRGSPSDAVEATTQALHVLQPGATAHERVEVLVIRGGYHLANENPWAAREDWQQAVALTPEHPAACRGLARLGLLGPQEFRGPERALSLLASLAHREQPDPEVVALLALAQVRLGRPREGLAALEKLTGPQPLVDYVRALGLHQAGQRREANDALAKGRASHDSLRSSLKGPQREEMDRLRSELEGLVRGE